MCPLVLEGMGSGGMGGGREMRALTLMPELVT